MKSIKKFMAALLLVVAAMLGVLAACGSDGVTLSFETNGAPAIEAVTVEEGTEYELPTPEWTGHVFEGWYADAAFTGAPVVSVTAEEDKTFYAKWTALSAVTLDLAGGTLEAGTTLYLQEGSNLYEFMQAYSPTLADHEFGGWFAGETELARSMLMPAGGITLTARYKVRYTVEVYEQNLARTGYDRAEDIVGYAFAGVDFTPNPDVHGFGIVEHDGSVATKKLSETASENVFRLYYDRLQFNVTYISADPIVGAESTMHYYGETFELPFDVFTSGDYAEEQSSDYLFSGWAATPGGATEYPYDASAETFNLAASAPAPTELTVEEDITLYAVWTEAYTDMFGGVDRLFIPDAAGETAYLLRAGVLFGGEFDAARGEFLFFDAQGDILTQGKIFDNKTFAYQSDSRSGFSATNYVVGQGLDENAHIYLQGGYNDITLAEADPEMPSLVTNSHGTYEIDEAGQLIATFTDGVRAGETLTIKLGYVQSGSSALPAFQIRDEVSYEWNTLYRIAVLEGGGITCYDSYTIELDGYGSAVIDMMGEEEEYLYMRSGEEITLYNTSGEVEATLLHSYDDVGLGYRHLYAFYFEDRDHIYTSATGEKLQLDGYYRATFTDANGTVMNGYYQYYLSSFFGEVIVFTREGYARYFLTEANVLQEATEDTEAVVEYTFSEKSEKYTEFYYADSESRYYAPLIVAENGLSATEESEVIIYGYTVSGKYEKVLVGTAQRSATQKGMYLFTTKEHCDYSEEVQLDPFDYSKIKFIVFGTGDYMTSSDLYPISYWYSVTFDGTEGEQLQEVELYNEAEGTGKLTVVGPFCIYEKDAETTITGQVGWVEEDRILRITVLEPAEGQSNYYYFEIENGTYTALSGLLGTVAWFDTSTGSIVSSETLQFDGKGGAVYSYEQTEEGSEPETHTVNGAFAKDTAQTEGGRDIYTFTGEGTTFQFVLFSSNGSTYFAKYHAEEKGTFNRTTDAGAETLLIDGSGLYAVYTPAGADEEPYMGNYLTLEENAVALVISEQYFIFFDIDKTAHTFTVRGGEYGTYQVLRNNGETGEYLQFNGYGKLTVYRLDGSDRVIIDDDGTYVQDDLGGFHIHYTETTGEGSVEHDLYGVREALTDSSMAFIVEEEEYSALFIDVDDWSVIMLDAYGSAIKIDAEGGVIEGWYYIITDDLLYFTDDDDGEALYRYDREDGTVTRISYTSKGYYTEDLEGLIFDENGFMIAGGDTPYFYEVLADRTVKLYYQDSSAAGANKYGFTSDTSFGAFEDTVDFRGKTYHVSDGRSIRFLREETDKDRYPIVLPSPDPAAEEGETVSLKLEMLTFNPTGGEQFTVIGSATVSGETVNVYVSREEDEEGHVSFYVTLPLAVGTYRFDLGIQYSGGSTPETSSNTFTITAMRTEETIYSTYYLLYYYIYASMYGQTIPDTYGTITLITMFDENGAASQSYVSAEFLADSGVAESDGKLVTLKEQTYTLVDGGEDGMPMYVIEYTGKDGLNYRLRFWVSDEYADIFGSDSYLVTFNRVETFTSGNYTVELERVFGSDSYRKGSIYSITLKEGDEVKANNFYFHEGVAYMPVAPESGNGYTYYKLTFTAGAEVGADGLQKYTSAAVEVLTGTRYFVKDSTTDFIDVVGGKAILLSADGHTYFIKESTYEESTATYTVTVTSGAQYTAAVDSDGNVTLTPVPAAEESAPAA